MLWFRSPTKRTHSVSLATVSDVEQRDRWLRALIELHERTGVLYRNAGERAGAGYLVALFRELGQQRERFALRLRILVRSEPCAAEPAWREQLWRWWRRAQAGLPVLDEHEEDERSLLGAVSHAEEFVQGVYDEAAREPVLGPPHAVLRSQTRELGAARAKVRLLRCGARCQQSGTEIATGSFTSERAPAQVSVRSDVQSSCNPLKGEFRCSDGHSRSWSSR
jgi:hypothetical protein